MWSPGQTVVHQEVWAGRLWAARPLIVVDDTADCSVLWIPHGTRRKVPVTPAHRPDPTDVHRRTIDNLVHQDWELGEHVWDVSSLWILRPGDWHSTWVSWLPDGAHLGWYVNLQRPMRRTPIGFEAMDLMLDIVADPHLNWAWKDRAEFDEIVERHIFDDELGRRVLSEAHAVVDDIEQRRWPFEDSWPTWRPDPGWGIPELPAGWDELSQPSR